MSTFLPGTQVETRGLHWEVVFSQAAGDQTLYRLRCLEGAMQGQEMDFLHPFESIVPHSRELRPEKGAPLQAWTLYHQAFLLEQALGPDALLAAQPGRLRIQPYQLVPVMRALQMGRPRLMLADGVGLGKTIQAGLVLAELIARRRAHRILIVSPAGPLMLQWQDEMLERFGLRFTLLSRESVQETRYQHELGTNPFDHVALGLISIDFAKQERVLQDLERTRYDIVVMDEAHHCMSLGSISDPEDSRRRRLAELLSRQSDALLLLTATPHDGFDPHFASLVELLDPSLVDGRGALRGQEYRRHVVRRLKKHIKDPVTGKELFKRRKVHPHAVALDAQRHPDFVEFQKFLLATITPRLKRAVRSRRYAEVLAFLSLLKRSVSTVHACRNTLATIGNRLKEMKERGLEDQEARAQRLNSLRDLRRRLDRFGVLSYEEEQDQARLEAEDMASEFLEGERGDSETPLSGPPLPQGAGIQAEERDLMKERDRERTRMKRLEETLAGLEDLMALADRALSQDPKLETTLEVLLHIRSVEPRANVLIYTEYTDSQEALKSVLDKAVGEGRLTGTVVSLNGDDDVATRKKVTDEFMSRDDLILVSTDATAEGLNLQRQCHHLIHLELPYNPNRLEQRNGRIDRFGQRFEPEVHYLYLGQTFEERLLMRLVQKYEKQRDRLTFVPNTLGVLSEGALSVPTKLLQGLSQEEPTLFSTPTPQLEVIEQDPDEVDNEAYRDLLAEVDKAFSKFTDTAARNQWLGDEGLQADDSLLLKAQQATQQAIDLAGVDLLGFVKGAVRYDCGADSVQEPTPSTVEMALTRTWTYGLEAIPGWDPGQRVLRLSTDLELNRDGQGNPLGYLGRAHPVVNRAIEKVRNVRFGTDAGLDPRVSAVKSSGAEPEMLLTFLGNLESGQGREFERILAVKVSRTGAMTPLTEFAQWKSLTEVTLAVSPKGLWEAMFQDWAPAAMQAACEPAARAFEGLSNAFRADYRKSIERERRSLEDWLQSRSDSLCGTPATPKTGDLFGQPPLDLSHSLGASQPPSWHRPAPPLERLSSFAADRDNLPSVRTEAANVVSLYKQRQDSLAQREALKPPTVSLLGLLMLVPDSREVSK